MPAKGPSSLTPPRRRLRWQASSYKSGAWEIGANPRPVGAGLPAKGPSSLALHPPTPALASQLLQGGN
nr:hypothetical protein FFPRI1PSEUD_30880 [Pseudomonas sp. FFPRI_1]